MNSRDCTILLDPVGDASIPEGYLLVDTEVAFLQHAVSGKPLFVRGDKLCRWAERFYRGRAILTQEVFSPSRYLKRLCPDLTDEQAKELAQRMQKPGVPITSEWTLPDVLDALLPGGRWYERPSPSHAAWWLLWLEENPTSDAECVLLKQRALWWQNEAGSPLSQLYQAVDAAGAEVILRRWMRLPDTEPLPSDLPSFPG